VSAPEPPVRRPRPRAGLAVQLGQTVLVLGAALLLIGLFLQGGPYAVGIGAVLAVVGAVVFVVGLRNRRPGPPA
jgi:peptidoglycan/LPS O-acetylase OafA/YrhL